MEIKKTIMILLFLLCILIIGTASAADNYAIVGDVTEDAVCISDNADSLELSQSDDVKGSVEKTQAVSSSQEKFIDVKSESQNEIENGLGSCEDKAKLKDDNSMSFDDLRNQIENASAGATITISKDNYTYENTTPIKVKDNLTIDGNNSWFDGTNANMSGLFCVEGANVVLKNLFFINWELEDSYNIIEWFGENGTLYNCMFVNNIAIDGVVDWSGENGVIDGCYFGYDYGMDNCGALCIYSDGVTVKNSIFETNLAKNDGGAIYSLGKGTTIANSTFTNCSSLTGNGGAIYIYSDYNLITNCTFTNCTALDNGGAIYVSGDYNIINDSKYFNNEAFNDGGAVYLLGTDCCVNNSYFESNSADEDGGAIYSKGTTGFDIDNCTFVNNSAEVYGGAVALENPSLVNGSVFENNSALAAGAVFSNDELAVFDSLFDQNTAETGGALVLSDDTVISDSNLTNNNASNGGAIDVIGDLTLEINGTQFKDNLADSGSNNIALLVNATVITDEETTSDSPLILKSAILSPISVENVTYGQILNITAVILDVDGNPMDKGFVKTEIDGVSYMALVSNGTGVLNVPYLKPGNYSSTVTFVLDGYENATAEYEFTVSGPTRILTKIDYKDMETIAVAAADGRIGEYFKITLKDENGNILANKDVKIGFNGKVYNRTTDENGSAQLQINLGYKGTYTFAMGFLGDDDYFGAFEVAKITVKLHTPKLTTPNKTYKSTAKTKTLTATFKTANGNPISGKKISFTVNGKSYTAKTNSKGVASVKVSLNKKGTYSFTAKFAGDNIFKTVSKKGKLTIK